MSDWHGWVIEQSLDDQSIFDQFVTLKMKSEEEDWKEHILEIPDDRIEWAVKFLRNVLKPGWYAHLIRDDLMIVVYKDRDFRVFEDGDYNDMRAWGLEHGVPEHQLPEKGLFDLARKSV